MLYPVVMAVEERLLQDVVAEVEEVVVARAMESRAEVLPLIDAADSSLQKFLPPPSKTMGKILTIKKCVPTAHAPVFLRCRDHQSTRGCAFASHTCTSESAIPRIRCI